MKYLGEESDIYDAKYKFEEENMKETYTPSKDLS